MPPLVRPCPRRLASRRRVFGLGLAPLALLLVWPARPARAQAHLPEYQVKAAFLYKFLSYVEWPVGTLAPGGGPFVIGVAGPEAVAEAVTEEVRRVTAGQSVGGHRVAVQRLAAGDTVGPVHALFVVGKDEAMAGELAAVRGRAVLTVTESGIESGGVIDFVVVNDRVRFDIALPAADANHLKISARLLNVARRVVPRQ